MAEAMTETMATSPAIESAEALTSAVQSLFAGFSVEITPASAKKIESFADLLRPSCRVMVTFLPGSDLQDTKETAERLMREGFIAVPHFAARSFPDAESFRSLVQDLSKVGVKEAVVLAGAVDKPLGSFTSSLDLLADGAFQDSGFTRISVAGHPEGSPDISDSDLALALRQKNEWAEQNPQIETRLITQFCFEAEPVLAWERTIRAAGNRLPIALGVPGPAQIKTLLMHAKNCGIGNSMSFLVKQAKNVSRLIMVNAPDKLIAGIAHGVAADPDSLLKTVHIYPLGGLKKSAYWSYAVADGTIKVEPSLERFSAPLAPPDGK